MGTGDYLKALAAAFILLVLNIAVTTAVITLDALFIEPGHPEAYYQGRAPQIAAWSAPPVGAVLLFVTALALGRGRPGRDPVRFALWLFAAYLALDASSGLAFDGIKAVADPVFLGSMALALAASVAGGWLARRHAAAA